MIVSKASYNRAPIRLLDLTKVPTPNMSLLLEAKGFCSRFGVEMPPIEAALKKAKTAVEAAQVFDVYFKDYFIILV